MLLSIVIPHLPERAALLDRALRSVAAQTVPIHDVIVEPDPGRTGEAATRNRGLARVATPLVAFLDDDNELFPAHLELLTKGLDASGADLAWSDYEVVGATYRASFIESSVLVRTEALRDVGGYPEPLTDTWPYRYPDWGMLAKLINAGYVFHRVNAVTWRYYIHDGNICGTGFGEEGPPCT